MFHRFDPSHLVRILPVGHQFIDKQDKQYAGEERECSIKNAFLYTVNFREPSDGIGHQVHERNVNHHTRRETQRNGLMMIQSADGEETYGNLTKDSAKQVLRDIKSREA